MKHVWSACDVDCRHISIDMLPFISRQSSYARTARTHRYTQLVVVTIQQADDVDLLPVVKADDVLLAIAAVKPANCEIDEVAVRLCTPSLELHTKWLQCACLGTQIVCMLSW
jgi:hypothetical protein